MPDVAFVAAIAQDDGTSRVATVADRLDVSYDCAQECRSRLTDASIISQARPGELTYAVSCLRVWL